MLVELDADHAAFRDTVRRFAEREVAPRAAEGDRGTVDAREMVDALRDAGLLGVAIPQEHGGSGGGMLGLCLAIEEVCRFDNSVGLLLLLTRLAAGPLLLGDCEAVRGPYLRGVADGTLRGSFCLSEPQTGSDAMSITTTALPDGDGGFVITGTKVWISGATLADFYIVWARTPDASGGTELSAFLVDRDRPGISIGRVDEKMGVRAVATAEVVLQECRVAGDHRISAPGAGTRHLMASLNSARPGVAARGLGLAEGALAYATQYARQRIAFGSPIIDLGAVQQLLADVAIGVEAARALVYGAARAVDAGRFGRDAAGYIAMAKCFATDLAVRASSDCLQVLGAAGYMADHPLERFYRDAKQLQIVEGTNQIQRVIIARALRDGLLASAPARS